MSDDANKERDRAVKQLQEYGTAVGEQIKRVRGNAQVIAYIRDERLSLVHQSDLLRSEVARTSDSAKRRKQSVSRLDLGLGLAKSELTHSQRVATERLFHSKTRNVKWILSGHQRTPGFEKVSACMIVLLRKQCGS